MHSEQINELATALAKAQGEIQSASLDKINPHFKSNYASLSSVWDACREALSKNGLSVVQTPHYINETLFLTTMLLHSSGQWMKSDMPVTSVKTTPQAIGASITYMRRYALSAMVGVAPGDDDDANAAMEEEKDPKKIAKPVRYNLSPAKEKEPVAPAISDEALNSFKSKYGIGSDSDHHKYLTHVSEGCNKPFDEMVKAAAMNESVFIDTFAKWKKSTTSDICENTQS